MGFSFEVAFKNPTEDRIHYHEANHIVDYIRDCANPVRAVESQLCINAVLRLQDCESKQPRPDSNLVLEIHIPRNSSDAT